LLADEQGFKRSRLCNAAQHIRLPSVNIGNESKIAGIGTHLRNHRIQKFTSEGVFLTKWATEGRGNGQFSNPNDLVVAPAGSIYVADADNDRIQAFKWKTY
jgi:sugar lactone lactonase YvrE